MNDAMSALCGRYSSVFEVSLRDLCSNRQEGVPPRLMEAMSYSLLAGGKRLRPALCMASAERCGTAPESVIPMASAIEFIHTASLIHDDLPCMDDDDLRRGRPTNHKVFGECMAVLAGDALMIWSFGYALENLPKRGFQLERVCRAVSVLSGASGPSGMIGGQVLDTDAGSRENDADFVRVIAVKKTAALIRASVETGAILGGADDSALCRYRDYGTHLGVAFQIVDDILDVTSTAEELGKTPHKDAAQDKATFIAAWGLDGAKRRAGEESEAAAEALAPLFPNGDPLIDLARGLAGRNR